MNIEKTYVINLKHRTDRWNSVQPELKKMELDPEKVIKFDAVKVSSGFIGCMYSHLAIIEECKDLDRFMILEDDVRFTDNVATLTRLALEQLEGKEWDMLYLGCNPQKDIYRFTKNTYRAKGCWTTHAMIFNGKRVTDYILKNQQVAHEKTRIDVFYADVIQEKFVCLALYPIAASQADSYSDVTKRVNHYYNEIIQNFNKRVQ